MELIRRLRERKASIGSTIYKSLLTLLLLMLVVVIVFPIVITVTHSFMSPSEIKIELAPILGAKSDEENADSLVKMLSEGEYVRLHWVPFQVTLNAYYDILLRQPQFLFLFWNSMKMTIPIVAGQLIVSLLAGYAFSQLRFRLRESLFFAYIVVMLMPFQVTLVPNYIMANWMGLINSEWSIILPGIFSAFGVFLMRQFMQAVPYSYVEAARMDGAGHFTIMLTIVLPMCRSGMAALAVLAFIDHWNMVEQPLIFLKDAMKQPLSVYLSYINEGDIGIAFTASVLYMLPAILLMLYAEKELVEGVQLSGIKG
ncbi:carbohydrate ABC transporter permease [Paenibacillus guangzhouensis]|uniref:carbohydrate ABC transporter permease n=1 Tax=Paenibacillus guangzhouensis TaxID=1473112 RepID=UPI0012669D90|nr:carbohydrate ABC transporter permease [Paenibacillus guangzhouensis]